METTNQKLKKVLLGIGEHNRRVTNPNYARDLVKEIKPFRIKYK